MTMDHLIKAYRTEPFRPFSISLTDGREFYVPSREFLLIFPAPTRTFIVGDKDGSHSVIDLLLVSSLDCLTKNGRARRHRRRPNR
jgi:hypothetical protein